MKLRSSLCIATSVVAFFSGFFSPLSDSSKGYLELVSEPVANVSASSLQPNQETSRFAVIGDYGEQSQPALDVSNLVKSWDPDFIITVGDNNYNCGQVRTIDDNIGKYYHEYIYPYTGRHGTGATTNRFFPSLGNHDWGARCRQDPDERRNRRRRCREISIEPYLNYFTLPDSRDEADGDERYYEFQRGPVHLFALDSDCNEPNGITADSRQAQWLQRRLAASTARWKLVYFHHPPFSSGHHGSKLEMRWPFKTWGATAVLCGHEHDYERLIVDELPYFICGLSGTPDVREFKQCIPGSQIRYNCDFGAIRVNANNERITFEFIVLNNSRPEVIDTYTIDSRGRHSPAPVANTCPPAPANTDASRARYVRALNPCPLPVVRRRQSNRR